MSGFRDFIKSIIAVRKNSTGAEYRRRRENFIEGTGVTITVADDPTDDEIDITIAASGASAGGIWPYYGGDGVCAFDGSATVLGLVPATSTYTLTRDIYLADGSSISAGAVILTAGFRIFCAGTLAHGGLIHANGVGAAGGGGTGTLGSGTGGSAGRSTTGVGGNGVAASAQNVGGTGGNAGASGAGQSGGNGGAATAVAFAHGGNFGVLYNLFSAQAGWQQPNNATANLQYQGGTGGGAGGCSTAGGASTSGAGGGGGGVVVVAAKTITGTGSITADGATGGNASGANAGGGGGGGGGVVIVIGTAASITMSAALGVGGAGVGTGASGSNGGAGTVVNFT